MRNRLYGLCLMALVVLMVATAVPAIAFAVKNATSPGTIEGSITEVFTGQPVQGAKLEFSQYDKRSGWLVKAAAYTDATGSYGCTLEGGVYNLTVCADGYYPRTFTSMNIWPGPGNEFSCVLKPETH